MVELKFELMKKYGTQINAANAWNVSPPFVSAVLNGKKYPTKQILDDLGFELIRTYKKINR